MFSNFFNNNIENNNATELQKLNKDYKELNNNQVYKNASHRNKVIVQEVINSVNKIYNEVCKAIQIFELEKDIYSFHNVMHKITEMLYKFEIFVFKGNSILVNSSIDTRFEKQLPYLLECVHSRNICNLHYFFDYYTTNNILSNLQYIKDFYSIELLKEIQKDYELECVLKKYIFEIVRNQFFSLLFCYKNKYNINNSLFSNSIKIVGVAEDIYNLSNYLKKELELVLYENVEDKFLRLKQFLKYFIEYKIQLLSDNEICLMLKILCVNNDENMSILNHKNVETVFFDMIKVFNENKNLLIKNSSLKFKHFRNICSNYCNNCGFLFINKEIINLIKEFNDYEIDSLKDMLKSEVYSNNSNKHFYSNISKIGSYILDLINKEVYNFILNK